MIPKTIKNKLYKQVKYELGYPIRKFELTNDMLDTFLEMCIEDYSSIINTWLMKQQWISLEGLNLDEEDIFLAITTKSDKYLKSFTHAYTKQTGIITGDVQGSAWELKRDFITVQANTQHYLIPKNREINEVLWEVPPEIGMGMADPFAMSGWTPGITGWSYMGRPAMYVQPTYSTLATAKDRRMKQKILKSTLTYKITALESGEKLLHLYPIPGSLNEIPDAWGKHYAGRKVFYWYYDTTNKSKNKCFKDNPDIIKTPNDVPLSNILWEDLNDIAKQQIRNMLIAKAKISIGGIRGFFSGDVGVAEKSLTLDYRHLLEEGEKLKTEAETSIKELLEGISQVNLTKERADIAENINKELTYKPIKSPIMIF